MKNVDIDFYDEFEGEVEIIFSIKTDEYTKNLRIWSGYFDMIMNKIEPSEDDGWTSLAYYYHLMVGWDTKENWQIPNLNEVLLQFQNIKIVNQLCRVGIAHKVIFTLLLPQPVGWALPTDHV